MLELLNQLDGFDSKGDVKVSFNSYDVQTVNVEVSPHERQSGFRNPGNFCSWIPENGTFELESRMQLLESGIHNVEFRIQHCAGLPCMGREVDGFFFV